MTYRDKGAGGIPLPHRTHRPCDSPMEAPAYTPSTSAVSLSGQEIEAGGNQASQPSNCAPLPFKNPEMIHVQRGGECEICEGDDLTALGPQAAPEEPPSDSNPDRLVQICWQPNAPCETCEGEHPDRVQLAKD